MERYFNIAGPCVPGEHYMIPALERLPEVVIVIDFSGKTLHISGLRKV